jgi:hypothetical protein
MAEPAPLGVWHVADEQLLVATFVLFRVQGGEDVSTSAEVLDTPDTRTRNPCGTHTQKLIDWDQEFNKP